MEIRLNGQSRLKALIIVLEEKASAATAIPTWRIGGSRTTTSFTTMVTCASYNLYWIYFNDSYYRLMIPFSFNCLHISYTLFVHIFITIIDIGTLCRFPIERTTLHVVIIMDSFSINSVDDDAIGISITFKVKGRECC